MTKQQLIRRDSAVAAEVATKDIREARQGETVRRVVDGVKGKVVDKDRQALSVIFEDSTCAIVRL